MDARPPMLAKVVVGKILSTVPHIRETLNWVFSFCDHFSVGKGLTLDGVKDGRPSLSLNIEEGDGIKIEDGDKGAVKFSVDIEDDEGVTVVGTDGSEATVTGTLTFASADDSNVEVTVSDDGDGNATVTVGVYWK